MKPGVELRFQEVVDSAVAGDAAHAGKRLRHDANTHMCFAVTVKVWLVARVKMAFVEYGQTFGLEGLVQLVLDALSQRHRVSCFHHSLVVSPLPVKWFQKASNIPVCQFLLSRAQDPIITLMKLDSKYFDGIRTKRRGGPKPEPAAPTCQWDGCENKGVHKAPVGRNAENEYFLFCFDHVKEYNKGYNYFSGLSDTEIARYQKEAVTGHRPTWTVGVNKSSKNGPVQGDVRSGSAASQARMRDPFGFVEQNKARGLRKEPRQRKLKTLEAKAFETLNLPANATPADVKAAYKELVKKHHPDANGGDRGSEDRFRAVIQAYQLLKQAGFC